MIDEAKVTKDKISPESHSEALKIANGTKKPGQTKNQTRLIAQGIEKGIADYKKQHKSKTRAQDKRRKKQSRNTAEHLTSADINTDSGNGHSRSKLALMYLPWLLLAASWAGFALYWQQ